MDETRIEKRDTATGWDFTSDAQSDPNATQRLNVSPTGALQNNRDIPSRRSVSSAGSRGNRGQKKLSPTTMIALIVAAAVLLIAILVIVLVPVFSNTTDDGKIMNNVFAAGVNIGGMTPDQAKAALHEATDKTYSQLDMTVQVLDTTITLSPKDTGASLDVDKLVEAAYNYGRNGQQIVGSNYTVSILPYLTLDTQYIQNQIDQLGRQYSTTLSQPSYRIEGNRPNLSNEEINTAITYQTLYIFMGTAEYGLNTSLLYEQIMDAYNINLFQVTGECSVVTPNEPDFLEELGELCYTAPVSASIDGNYNVTPEVYGYGISPEDLLAKMAEAKYGDTLTIPLTYIEPDITEDMLTGEMFQDVLAQFQTAVSEDVNRNANLNLACKALNGTIIKAGEEFSFNSIIGEPTIRKGYKNVNIYLGKSLTSVAGGGISQVASTLYYCALLSDLEILERHSGSYAPSYITPGFDAQVYYGSLDLRFRNTTEQPIRIEAAIQNGYVYIRLIGTDSKTYSVELTYDITKTKNPGVDYITLNEENAGGYQDGDILADGITGYTVRVTRTTYNKLSGSKVNSGIISETSYAKRNTLVVKIDAQDIVDPTEPSDPTTPTDPTVDPDEGN